MRATCLELEYLLGPASIPSTPVTANNTNRCSSNERYCLCGCSIFLRLLFCCCCCFLLLLFFRLRRFLLIGLFAVFLNSLFFEFQIDFGFLRLVNLHTSQRFAGYALAFFSSSSCAIRPILCFFAFEWLLRLFASINSKHLVTFCSTTEHYRCRCRCLLIVDRWALLSMRTSLGRLTFERKLKWIEILRFHYCIVRYTFESVIVRELRHTFQPLGNDHVNNHRMPRPNDFVAFN